MKEFVNKHKDDIFRYVVYRKIWTPYEMDRKFTDELETETEYTFAKITDCIDLGSGDWLLEFEQGYVEHDDEDKPVFYPNKVKSYKRLSEIQLSKFEYDNKERVI